MMEILASDLAKVLTRIKISPKARKDLLLVGVILFFLPLVLAAIVAIWAPETAKWIFAKDNPASGFALLPGFLCLGLVFLTYLQDAGDKREDPVTIANVFGATPASEGTRDTAIDDGDIIAQNIRVTLAQVAEYYSINKAQARNSFWLSVALIILGFGPLAYAVWRMNGVSKPTDLVAAVSAASGVLLDFIAATAFFVYRSAIRQTNIYFAQLSRLQDTMLAIELTGRITKEDTKAQAIERVISKLLDRSLSEAPGPLDAPTKPMPVT